MTPPEANVPPAPPRTIRLRDGRTLGYAEYGDPGGRPVMFFHGLPGSYVLGRVTDAPGRRVGARVIAPERPGCGVSTFKADRTIGAWPSDVIELADALGLEKFGVVGFSAGGPYAAACALKIPERLTRAMFVCGMGPPESMDEAHGMRVEYRLGFVIGRQFPWAAEQIWAMAGAFFRDWRARFAWKWDIELSPADREALASTDLPNLLVDDILESFRSGSRGPSLEALLLTRDWDFRPEDISMHIRLWQAELDTSVPAGMARHQARRLPDCELILCPGEGHFSMLARRMDEVLKYAVEVPG